MKRLFLLASLLVLPLLATAQGNFRFIQNGEFGALSGSTGGSGLFNLQVSRGFTTSGGASASLQYSAFSETSSSITITNVFGPIPSEAFTGVNTHRLVLDIDTTTLATLTSQSCTLDLTTFQFTCFAGPAGLIHLEWRENGAQRSIVDLKQTTHSGPVTTLIHQKSDNSTAVVEGSVFGMPVSGFLGVSATVGVNHQSTLEITHD